MKRYIIYSFSGLLFVGLVAASLVTYEHVYTVKKPLNNIIKLDNIKSINLNYYDDSLNKQEISLNEEKKQDFVNTIEHVKFRNLIKYGSSASKEYIVIEYNDDLAISFSRYYVFNEDKTLDKRISIDEISYKKILEVFDYE